MMTYDLNYSVFIILQSCISMRFLTLLKEKSVPEWWSCYYDYENMKVLISIVTKGHNIIAKIK